MFCFDCIFTIFIMIIVVFIWRDFWTLLDLRLLPDNELLSATASLVNLCADTETILITNIKWVLKLQAMGYFLAILCFTLQRPINVVCKLSNELRIFPRSFFITLCLFSTITIWRGLWILMSILTGRVTLLLTKFLSFLLILIHCEDFL